MPAQPEQRPGLEQTRRQTSDTTPIANIQRICNIMIIVGSYWIVINLIGFIVMGVDKKRAVRGAWRISEAALFGIALIGGALGCTLGMRYFRHKTKHWYFKYGMPAIFAVQVLCAALLLQKVL